MAEPAGKVPTTERTLPSRARVMLPLCAAVLLGLAVHRLYVAEVEPRPYVEFYGRTMGTTYSVKVASDTITDAERADLAREIETQLEVVNALMSTYRSDSELSRFNAHASVEPFALSRETVEVFAVALQVSERSAGAFDVTVGPLVAAWGFGATERPPGPPSEEELRELAARVGYAKLTLDEEDGTLRKIHPAVQCDLSAIAKGYGVDLVARALEEQGYENHLVEVGGELHAHGRKLDGEPWRVGIELPDSLTRSSHEVVRLHDVSLATSGDYRDYYEVDGERISHTIDPRIGRPIRHNLASVSVLHPEAVWADALATTLSVLGPEQGFAWAVEQQLAALFLVRESEGVFKSLATPAFETLRQADR
ncbi:MAG: FAD:protein FMN transferase [bacterium]|nr:FAD:protein FMN transferase [bacterium]